MKTGSRHSVMMDWGNGDQSAVMARYCFAVILMPVLFFLRNACCVFARWCVKVWCTGKCRYTFTHCMYGRTSRLEEPVLAWPKLNANNALQNHTSRRSVTGINCHALHSTSLMLSSFGVWSVDLLKAYTEKKIIIIAITTATTAKTTTPSRAVFGICYFWQHWYQISHHKIQEIGLLLSLFFFVFTCSCFCKIDSLPSITGTNRPIDIKTFLSFFKILVS